MSRLQEAIVRGLANGNLAAQLDHFRNAKISSLADADAICAALRGLPVKLPPQDQGGATSPLHALTGMFQQVENAASDAYSALCERGIPELIRIFDQRVAAAAGREIDDLMFVLKIAAMYGTREGTDAVVRAAKCGFQSDGFMWSVILRSYTAAHPHHAVIFEELSNPLPTGFVAVALLDAGNAAWVAGAEGTHPFDSSEGKQRLEQWLLDGDPENFSYAHSATAALPFISNPERDQLLALAMDHADIGVQMEAAWASAKLGSSAGVKCLARYCLDVAHARTACQYLAELGREDAIPEEASDPDFQAQAEFAGWLAHPNELGRTPDELRIVDSRTLAWPPTGENKRLWLVEYVVRAQSVLDDDQSDVGMVGSITFCLFSYKLAERPPEDGYAIHCCWELEGEGLIKEIDVDQLGTADEWLKQWNNPSLRNVELILGVQLAIDLDHPQRKLALASARRNDEAGWVVFDGPRSAWYSQADMPDDVHASTVLKVHLGRALLGFQAAPDRAGFLRSRRTRKPAAPEAVIAAYEVLLADPFPGGTYSEHQGRVTRHFLAYVDALAQIKKGDRFRIVIETYQRLLGAALALDEGRRSDAFNNFGPLGEHFDAYVESLAHANRHDDIRKIVQLLTPHWDHNLGYGKLGSAAFRGKQLDIAETFFEKLRCDCPQWWRCAEMNLLAELWMRSGKTSEAHALLVECLHKLAEEAPTASGSDIKLFEDWFQNRLQCMQRLFPNVGDRELNRLGVPTSTLRREQS